MLDAIPIRHRKVHPQKHDPHHNRVYSSPDQVFENPQVSNSSKWQQIFRNNEKQVYEHTNKSDDSLELMPTIAMGYENSINKKLQQRGRELRITGDGYYFEQSYQEPEVEFGADKYYRYGPGGNGDNRYQQQKGYGKDSWTITPDERYGMREPIETQSLQQQEYPRNRIHPVYDQELSRYEEDVYWRDGLKNRSSGGYDSEISRNSRSFPEDPMMVRNTANESDLKSPFGSELQRSKRSTGELRPQMIPREQSHERLITPERVKTPNGDDTERKVSQNSEYFEPSSMIPSESQVQQQQQQQQPQPQHIKSPKKKGILRKMFTSDGKRKKFDRLKKNNRPETTSINNISDSSKFLEPKLIDSDLVAANDEGLQLQQETSNDSTPPIINIISNFPIISNIFNKIDESSMPNQTKFLSKALLLFWILYEINTVFEIIGEWFKVFGSIFGVGSDGSISS